MKFRNPKTGEVFEDIEAARYAYCKPISLEDCEKCPLNSAINGTDDDMDCGEFVKSYPTVAARLMVLEVITGEEEPMEKNDKPRICEVLGVEVGERFGDGVFEYEITPDDKMMWFSNCGRGESTAKSLIEIINHPDRIIRKPRFTEEDVVDAAAILRWYPTAWVADRGAKGHLIVGDKDHVVVAVFGPDVNAMPSLCPGQSMPLNEIIK